MRYCWWREGGRCYNDKWSFKRDESGRSDKFCNEECSHICRTNLLDIYLNRRELTAEELIDWERIQKNP